MNNRLVTFLNRIASCHRFGGEVIKTLLVSAILVFAMLITTLSACSKNDSAISDMNPEDPQEHDAVSESMDTGAEKNPTEKTIASGKLKGIVQENGSYAWLGIPYAKPPVGELRWKLPQPVDSWEGTLAANNGAQLCPQFVSTVARGIEDSNGDGLIGDEDCLYLSVYSPSTIKDSDKKLPVMYWIFGGGNNSGYAGSYNGGTLAQSQDVVVVTVNYRLGTLGWFLHPAILMDGATGAEASGNWSTVDTILGLEWVRDNIGVFGGDKNNVTVFGESAGGGNVMSLVTSSMAKGLFHRAIVESGGISTTSVAQGQNYIDDQEKGHLNSSREIINKILVRDGKAKNRTEAKKVQQAMSSDEIKALLYSQPATTFLKLYNPEGARNYPAPKKFADGTVFVKEPPLEQLASGNYNQVPIILGTNRDERRIYLYRDPAWAPLIKNDPAEYIRVAKYPTDLWKLGAVDGLAKIMSPIQGDTVFTYRFDWDEEAVYDGVDLAIGIGAGHSTEMAFIFGDWDVGFVPQEIMYDPVNLDSRLKLSASMMSYWANFAYNGNPGKGKLGDQVEWKAWENGNKKPKMIIFDADQDGGIRMSNAELTAEKIKAEFLKENFTSEKLQCDMYKTTFKPLGLYDEKEFKALNKTGCK